MAFEQPIRLRPTLLTLGLDRAKNHNTAVFRQVHMEEKCTHHDGLELPDGEFVLVTDLREGQRVTVLQLPADKVAVTPAQDAAWKSEKQLRINELAD